MGLVVTIAKQLWAMAASKAHMLRFADLVQLGYLALRRAWQNYDATKGTKFGSYAGVVIRQQLSDELERDSTVLPIPRRIHWLGRTDKKHYQRLLSRRTRRRLQALKPASHAPPEVAEQLSVRDSEQVDMLDALLVAMGTQVTDERFGRMARLRAGISCPEPMTLQQIGDLYHLTKERVRQILDDGYQELREHFPELVGEF
jgi:RNA polymerase primary sigma factor